MDSLKRRNPPKTSKTAKFDAEILLSLYREGGYRRVFRSARYEAQIIVFLNH